VAVNPRVMGIVNVTPDSFFAATRTTATADAIARGDALFAAGADIVDVGGESTRPGADAVPADVELRRVVPVVAALAQRGPVSIDTQKAVVARAAVAAGATILNDVSASLGAVAGELGVGYVAMHRQGDPHSMQRAPHYGDVVAEVGDFLVSVGVAARAAGVTELWLDPGIGFGKTVAHNLALLAHLDDLVARAAALDAGVLVGTSRKSFLGTLAPAPLDVDERLDGSIATAAWAIVQGAAIVRVHDVASTVHVRDLAARPLEGVGA
jgi:dihydropteroate synthase